MRSNDLREARQFLSGTVPCDMGGKTTQVSRRRVVPGEILEEHAGGGGRRDGDRDIGNDRLVLPCQREGRQASEGRLVSKLVAQRDSEGMAKMRGPIRGDPQGVQQGGDVVWDDQ